MTYELTEYQGFSRQEWGEFPSLVDAVQAAKIMIANRKWLIVDERFDDEDDAWDCAASSGTTVSTFHVQPISNGE